MLSPFKIKALSWTLIRAHLCTIAVAFSFNSTWRTPRDAFRYGGLSYTTVLTVAMVLVASPAVLLQLAVGQLSQQDAVGVWRAVPFFRGVGYLRLLVSFLGAVYTVNYVAITVMYFFYTINHSISFWNCEEQVIEMIDNETENNASCINGTLLMPVNEQPEYYIAISLIVSALWILFPFVLYNPIKLMKKIFYVSAPTLLILNIVIVSTIGDWRDVAFINVKEDWQHLVDADIWHAALTQAFLSTQVAGGYLISAGDTVYANTNIQWTTLVIIGINILASWMGVLFWFGISGSVTRDQTSLAVLVTTYQVALEKDLSKEWPLLIFATLILSGIITMLTQLYPLYERFRRAGGTKWRHLSVGSSLVGVSAGLATLAGQLPALELLEDLAVPFLVSVATTLEISAFILIYGWRVLVEDIEFLVGRDLSRLWAVGWFIVPCVSVSLWAWWVSGRAAHAPDWREPPWETSGMVTVTGLIVLVFLTFAVVAVVRQVQYDALAKLKSSFKPSRHWGPRDPITHYYWLARREDPEQNVPRTRYNRRQLGQFSGNVSFLNLPSISAKIQDMQEKTRSNSDDWLYTINRKQSVAALHLEHTKKRSKSLDWTVLPSLRLKSGYLEHKKLANISPFNSDNTIQENIKNDFINISKKDAQYAHLC